MAGPVYGSPPSSSDNGRFAHRFFILFLVCRLILLSCNLRTDGRQAGFFLLRPKALAWSFAS